MNKRRRSQVSAKRSKGVALLGVLGIVALLTLMATAVATSSLSHRRAAESHARSVQALTLADSAIRLVLLQLHETPSQEQARMVGAPFSARVLSAPVQIEIERDAGRIGLNAAGSDLLFSALAAHGWPENEAERMAARILDWRDADDELRRGGAERREYTNAGLGYVPRNGPFETVEELRQVIGGERLSPEFLSAFTVYSHSDLPLEESANDSALRALSWADQRQLRGRRWIHTNVTSGVPSSTGSETGAGIRSLHGEVVRIRACAEWITVTVCRQAAVRLSGKPESPFQIFAW